MQSDKGGTEAPPPERKKSEDLEYGKFSVLVVDDQEGVRELIERVIGARLGCEVSCATHGEEALEMLGRSVYDVMITDMLMPGLHGLEFLGQTRSSYPEMDTIVMTGYASEFPYVEVTRAGANDFIDKPFPPAELEAKLIRIFEERKLRQSHSMAESKYRNLFELSMDGMLVLEKEDYRLTDINQAFYKLTGRGEGTFSGESIFDCFDADCHQRVGQMLDICATCGQGAMNDLHLKGPEGRSLIVDISVTFLEAGYEELVFLTFKDVTAKREVDEKLAAAAQKDVLTGLYNKRSFQNRIEWVTSQARQKESDLALLVIDLDNFKKCNDTYGHQTGDKILQAVGRVITKCIRGGDSDQGFRVGGDEFSVILQDTCTEGARVVAERMCSEFQSVETFGSTMSVGIAVYQGDQRPEDFIHRADEALYKAKGAGKNTIHTA